MTYKMTITTPVEWMPDMEMEVAFKEPGLMRMTMKGGHVSVMDAVQGKGLSINKQVAVTAFRFYSAVLHDTVGTHLEFLIVAIFVGATIASIREMYDN